MPLDFSTFFKSLASPQVAAALEQRDKRDEQAKQDAADAAAVEKFVGFLGKDNPHLVEALGGPEVFKGSSVQQKKAVGKYLGDAIRYIGDQEQARARDEALRAKAAEAMAGKLALGQDVARFQGGQNVAGAMRDIGPAMSSLGGIAPGTDQFGAALSGARAPAMQLSPESMMFAEPERLKLAMQAAESMAGKSATEFMPVAFEAGGISGAVSPKTGAIHEKQTARESEGYVTLASPDDPFGRTQIRIPLKEFKRDYPDEFNKFFPDSGAAAPGSKVTPDDRDVKWLKENPSASRRATFERKYGAGSAARFAK